MTLRLPGRVLVAVAVSFCLLLILFKDIPAAVYSVLQSQAVGMCPVVETDLPVHNREIPLYDIHNLSTVSYCRHKAHSKDDCFDKMLNKTVFVNAMSSNHFKESLNMIGSILENMPGAKIIVYNLGLCAPDVAKLRTICGIEVRSFNFEAYPSHVSQKDIINFAWKPLIIQEVSLEYEIVVWVDTSIRFLTTLKQYVFPYLLSTNFTYVGHPLLYVAHVQYAHNGILQYFNLTREELKGLPVIEAGYGIYWMTEAIRRVISDWVDCALHHECITPEGAYRMGRKKPGKCGQREGGIQATEYIDCFLFDQSALNLILYKHYGRGLAEAIAPAAKSTGVVLRGDDKRRTALPHCDV